ncbi:MAG: uroporphyrinogen decarboxylase family protein [Planctomycetes bacterium]|jgi:hypothetical protein|nr:uroporphyrinogen decarboxylase family protein [Planctomycetota bacterium]
MARDRFDQERSDSQATPVAPVAAANFDFDAYAAWEESLRARCRRFWAADAGVLVYRRMRVAEVFSYGCREMQASLAWQLGALHQSLAYPADVPNFLEPWYGIGTIASAFGIDYLWQPGQAPAVRPAFVSVEEALRYEPQPLAQTPIGAHTLAMIDYFLDQTGGRLPLCLTDTQSPLNVAGHVVDLSRLFLEVYDRPEQVAAFLRRIAELIAEFSRVQARTIGDALVWPGHGYASSRCFAGLGVSDDNALMISGPQYRDLAAPAVEYLGRQFHGWAFHSCGDWSSKIDVIQGIPGLRMVDAAFSAATDPSPNNPELFAAAFAGTGIVLNARIVGGAEVVVDTVKRLWIPGMKLIVVTYCQSPDEQRVVYDRIHEICV